MNESEALRLDLMAQGWNASEAEAEAAMLIDPLMRVAAAWDAMSESERQALDAFGAAWDRVIATMMVAEGLPPVMPE